MKNLPLRKVFTLIEPGPVVLVTTHDGRRPNVMTISWTSVLDFDGTFSLTTGLWNASYLALRDRGECVVAIPPASWIDTAIGIGMCSGSDTDKFAKFSLQSAPAHHVRAPLLPDALANIECRVADIIERYNIVILEAVAAWVAPDYQTRPMLHAAGDGRFTADGERFERRDQMRAKLPEGV